MIQLEHILKPEVEFNNEKYKLNKYTFDKINVRIYPTFNILKIKRSIIALYINKVIRKAIHNRRHTIHLIRDLSKNDLYVYYFQTFSLDRRKHNITENQKLQAPYLINSFISILISMILSKFTIESDEILSNITDVISHNENEKEIFLEILNEISPLYHNKLDTPDAYFVLKKALTIRFTYLANQFVLNKFFKSIDVRKISGKIKNTTKRYSEIRKKLIEILNNEKYFDSIKTYEAGIKNQILTFLKSLYENNDVNIFLSKSNNKSLSFNPALGFHILYPIQNKSSIFHSPTIFYSTLRNKDEIDVKHSFKEGEGKSFFNSFITLQSYIHYIETNRKNRILIFKKEFYAKKYIGKIKELYHKFSNLPTDEIEFSHINPIIQLSNNLNLKNDYSIFYDKRFLGYLILYIYKSSANKFEELKNTTLYKTNNINLIQIDKLIEYLQNHQIANTNFYKKYFYPLLQYYKDINDYYNLISSKDAIIILLREYIDISKLFYSTLDNLYNILERNNDIVLNEESLIQTNDNIKAKAIINKISNILISFHSFLSQIKSKILNISDNPLVSKDFENYISSILHNKPNEELKNKFNEKFIENLKPIFVNLFKTLIDKKIEDNLLSIKSLLDELSKIIKDPTIEKLYKNISKYVELINLIKKDFEEILNSISIEKIIELYSKSHFVSNEPQLLQNMILKIDTKLNEKIQKLKIAISNILTLDKKILGKELDFITDLDLKSRNIRIYDYGLKKEDYITTQSFHEIRRGQNYILEPFYSISLYVIYFLINKIFKLKHSLYIKNQFVKDVLSKDSLFYTIHRKNLEIYSKRLLEEFSNLFSSNIDNIDNPEEYLSNVLALSNKKLSKESIYKIINTIKNTILNHFNYYYELSKNIRNVPNDMSTYIVIDNERKLAAPIYVKASLEKEPNLFFKVIDVKSDSFYKLPIYDLKEILEFSSLSDDQIVSSKAIESLRFIKYLPIESIEFLKYVFNDLNIKTKTINQKINIPFLYVPYNFIIKSTKDLEFKGIIFSALVSFVLSKKFVQKCKEFIENKNIDILKELATEFHRGLNSILLLEEQSLTNIMEAITINFAYYIEILKSNKNFKNIQKIEFDPKFNNQSSIDILNQYLQKIEFKSFKPINSILKIRIEDFNVNLLQNWFKTLKDKFKMQEILEDKNKIDISTLHKVKLNDYEYANYDDIKFNLNNELVLKNLLEFDFKNSLDTILAFKYLILFNQYFKFYAKTYEIFVDLAKLCSLYIGDFSKNKEIFKKRFKYSIFDLLNSAFIQYLMDFVKSKSFRNLNSFSECSAFEKALFKTYFSIPIDLHNESDTMANKLYNELLFYFIPKKRLNLMDLSIKLFNDIHSSYDSLRIGTLEFHNKKLYDQYLTENVQYPSYYSVLSKNILHTSILFLALYTNIAKNSDKDINEFLSKILNYLEESTKGFRGSQFLKVLLYKYLFYLLHNLDPEQKEGEELLAIQRFLIKFFKNNKQIIEKAFESYINNGNYDNYFNDFMKEIDDKILQSINKFDDNLHFIILSSLKSILKFYDSEQKNFKFILSFIALYYLFDKINPNEISNLLKKDFTINEIVYLIHSNNVIKNSSKHSEEIEKLKLGNFEVKTNDNKIISFIDLIKDRNDFKNYVDFVNKIKDDDIYKQYMSYFNEYAIQKGINPFLVQRVLHSKTIQNIINDQNKDLFILWSLCLNNFVNHKLNKENVLDILSIITFNKDKENLKGLLFKKNIKNSIFNEILSKNKLKLVLLMKLIVDKIKYGNDLDLEAHFYNLKKEYINEFESLKQILKSIKEFIKDSIGTNEEIALLFSEREFLNKLEEFYKNYQFNLEKEITFLYYKVVLNKKKDFVYNFNKYSLLGKNLYNFIKNNLNKIDNALAEKIHYQFNNFKNDFLSRVDYESDMTTEQFESYSLEKFYDYLGETVLKSNLIEEVLAKVKYFIHIVLSNQQLSIAIVKSLLLSHLTKELLHLVAGNISKIINSNIDKLDDNSKEYRKKLLSRITSKNKNAAIYTETFSKIREILNSLVSENNPFFTKEEYETNPNLQKSMDLLLKSPIAGNKSFVLKSIDRFYGSFLKNTAISSIIEDLENDVDLERKLVPFKIDIKNTEDFERLKNELTQYLSNKNVLKTIKYEGGSEKLVRNILNKINSILYHKEQKDDVIEYVLSSTGPYKSNPLLATKQNPENQFIKIHMAPAESTGEDSHIFLHLGNLVFSEYSKLNGFRFDYENFNNFVKNYNLFLKNKNDIKFMENSILFNMTKLSIPVPKAALYFYTRV